MNYELVAVIIGMLSLVVTAVGLSIKVLQYLYSYLISINECILDIKHIQSEVRELKIRLKDIEGYMMKYGFHQRDKQ